MATATALSRGRRLSLTLPRLDTAGVLTGALYLIFFGFGFMSFTDPDYFWHLRTGQYIVQTHSIPTHDLFSYTVPGKHWLTHEWLSEALIYLGVSRFGYAVTLGIFVAITLASFGLMQRLLLKLGTPPMAAILLIVLGLMMSGTYWTVRPQMLSWAFIALFTSALFQARKPVWLLVPTMALWANLHLAFVMGIAIAAMWFASRVWELHVEKRDFDWRSGALFVVACAAATLINPSGPMVLSHALPFIPVFGSAIDAEAITEWASPSFHSAMHAPLLAGIVLLIVLGLTGQVRDVFAVLLAATFAVLALYSSRFQPMFAIAFLPAAGLAARDISIFARRNNASSRSTLNWVLVGLTAVTILIAIPLLPQAQVFREPRTNSRPYYPAPALAWVQEHRPDANVFANYAWGGYFINGLYPSGHVFVDGRADMYGSAVMKDYWTINGAKDGWQKLLDDSRTDVVVVSPSSRIAQELRYTPGWATKLETDQANVFVRGP